MEIADFVGELNENLFQKESTCEKSSSDKETDNRDCYGDYLDTRILEIDKDLQRFDDSNGVIFSENLNFKVDNFCVSNSIPSTMACDLTSPFLSGHAPPLVLKNISNFLGQVE